MKIFFVLVFSLLVCASFCFFIFDVLLDIFNLLTSRLEFFLSSLNFSNIRIKTCSNYF